MPNTGTDMKQLVGHAFRILEVVVLGFAAAALSDYVRVRDTVSDMKGEVRLLKETSATGEDLLTIWHKIAEQQADAAKASAVQAVMAERVQHIVEELRDLQKDYREQLWRRPRDQGGEPKILGPVGGADEEEVPLPDLGGPASSPLLRGDWIA